MINFSNTNTKDINDCKPDPCKHGSCVDRVISYTCVCDPGYSGVNCNKGESKQVLSIIDLAYNNIQQY